MAETVAGWLRRAGARHSAFKLIVALCCNHRMFGEKRGGVGEVCGWLEGCLGVAALLAEMAPGDGGGGGAVSLPKRL